AIFHMDSGKHTPTQIHSYILSSARASPQIHTHTSHTHKTTPHTHPHTHTHTHKPTPHTHTHHTHTHTYTHTLPTLSLSPSSSVLSISTIGSLRNSTNHQWITSKVKNIPIHTLRDHDT